MQDPEDEGLWQSIRKLPIWVVGLILWLLVGLVVAVWLGILAPPEKNRPTTNRAK